MRVAFAIAIAVMILIRSVPAVADIPQVINYQGKVTDTGGTPVADGMYNMQFDIYNSDTGGTSLWSSGTISVEVTGGVFSVLLGQSPQPTLNLDFGQDYWLGVTVESDVQAPRQRLGSVSYSYMASGLVAGTEIMGAVDTGTNSALKVTNTAPSGFTYGVYGVSSSTQGRGVCGHATATSGLVYGVFGRCDSTLGHGVYGNASATSGDTNGVYGVSFSSSGRGVYGVAVSTIGSAVGGEFESASTSGAGVLGWATATGGGGFGVFGVSVSTFGRGVYGNASASVGSTYGVFGYAISTSGTGVYGYAFGSTGTNYGVHGRTNSSAGYAGYFEGDVHINGTITKSSGSFLIDHPLDPENKLLRHNFVESPENLLIYRGKARLDGSGQAVVQLPHYFKALTREGEATVTLTSVGKPFLTGYDIEPDRSCVRIYGESNREVSWVVYADRDDPVIHQLARPVEEDKGPENKYCDRGKLLNPTAYGYPESRGRYYEQHERERSQMEAEAVLRKTEHPPIDVPG